ncbi:hypothetical protein HAX54_006718 [Datura stramonium]|uniref:Uncharacterized protein n=1 Tax=Datura stramonium TaxID=4076 RepID=A0ABS8WYY4_DATST|nr:hypothetical protein [Datura stramonium]
MLEHPEVQHVRPSGAWSGVRHRAVWVSMMNPVAQIDLLLEEMVEAQNPKSGAKGISWPNIQGSIKTLSQAKKIKIRTTMGTMVTIELGIEIENKVNGGTEMLPENYGVYIPLQEQESSAMIESRDRRARRFDELYDEKG